MEVELLTGAGATFEVDVVEGAGLAASVVEATAVSCAFVSFFEVVL